MTNEELRDRCRGALVGGAVGDALGYAVEFLSLKTIRKRFGLPGIMEYELDRSGVAVFSDDTQMSLFTAEGLLSGMMSGGNAHVLPSIRKGYEHWYATQTRVPSPLEGSWLSHLKALWAERAPGTTCMSAMDRICYGDGCPVENNSKGCGGVMRVAPIGIYAGSHPDGMSLIQAGRLAGQAAEITHKHPLSTLSSMAAAMIVAVCLTETEIDRDKFAQIVNEKVFKLMGEEFAENSYLDDLAALVRKALGLAISDKSDTEAIRELGEGWVAEETLAIALFSVMRYVDDFEKCIVCAVNHDGDSDSTGAVAGNIIGAILGYGAIPKKFTADLELHDVIKSVADDLGGFAPADRMTARYADHRPYDVLPAQLFASQA